jgi:hypothetical protein
MIFFQNDQFDNPLYHCFHFNLAGIGRKYRSAQQFCAVCIRIVITKQLRAPRQARGYALRVAR